MTIRVWSLWLDFYFNYFILTRFHVKSIWPSDYSVHPEKIRTFFMSFAQQTSWTIGRETGVSEVSRININSPSLSLRIFQTWAIEIFRKNSLVIKAIYITTKAIHE